MAIKSVKPVKATKATKATKTAVCGAQNHVTIPLSWGFARLPYPLQRQVVKNAFSWGVTFFCIRVCPGKTFNYGKKCV